MRVTQAARAVVSTRMTSAPRCASVWVQNGPAHAHVKSRTRTPLSGESAIAFSPRTSQLRNMRSQTTPVCLSLARRSRGTPNSAQKTSSFCSPSRGAGRRSAHLILPYCEGAPGRVSLPKPGWLNCTKYLRSRRWSLSYICCIVLTGANGMRAPCRESLDCFSPQAAETLGPEGGRHSLAAFDDSDRAQAARIFGWRAHGPTL